jgi:hypothetical protein
MGSWWAGSEDHRPDEGNSSPEKEGLKWDTPELPIEGIFREVTIGWVTRSMFTISIWPTCTAGPAGTKSGSYNFNLYRNLVSGFDVQPKQSGIMGILSVGFFFVRLTRSAHQAVNRKWSSTIFWKMPHENVWRDANLLYKL